QSITVQPSLTLCTRPSLPRHTSSTSLPPGSDRKIVRHSAAISPIDAVLTPSASSRFKGAASRSAASTFSPLFFARLRHIGSPMVPTPMNPIMSATFVSNDSVDDEKLCAALGLRAMAQRVVGDLVALARLQHHVAAISQLGVQLALEHQQDMALLAPVVGQVARR